MTDNLHTLAVLETLEPLPLCRQSTVPSSLALLGPAAHFAWDEFFIGRIRNRHTRTVYGRSVRNFLKWAEWKGVAIERITPGMVGTYLDRLSASPPTKKLILAALRGFFDALVLRHVLILNPAASVRAERYEVVEGKTPEITPVQARALLDSIDDATLVGLRDKAVIATLIYTAARAGAVGKLRRKDLSFDGSQYTLAFGEKGGKHRSIPVRHDLELLLLKLLDETTTEFSSPLTPLFPTLAGRTGALTGLAMSGTDIWRMVKRRLRFAGLPLYLSPHSFRVATCTDLLTQGVPLGDVQYLAGHADPRTTRLYDRRPKKVTRSLVERISI
ncbi:MAG TPA: tyrosine-type recombinase/integrase [Gemmataceae bacterium]|nr:tyrosine-type recombinase/integrase [Gemmataceae bacterium]